MSNKPGAPDSITDAARPRARPWEAIPLFLLLAFALYGLQYTTLVKFADLAPSLSYVSWEQFAAAVREQGIEFGPLDTFWCLALLAVLAAAVLLEHIRRGLTIFCDHIFASPVRTPMFLAAVSFVAVRYYFAPGGLPWVADAPAHILYAHLTHQAFAAGELPIWTNALGAGSPYTQFYGFLFFYLTGAVAWLLDALYPAIKAVMAICHVASGLGVYFLVARLCRSRRAGFAGGLVMVLCFWHVQQVLIMGRLNLSLFYALLPWPFYLFERLRDGARWPRAATGGLFLGLLAFTHPGYAFWATALFALYVGARLWSLRNLADARSLQLTSAAMLGGGLAYGAYLTLGMWLERGSTGLQEGFYLLDIPAPTLWHLLVWSNYRFWILPYSGDDFHWYGGYLGLIAVAWAVVAAIRTRRAPRGVATLIALGAAFALIFGHDVPPLRWITVVQAIPAGRYLLFVAFFLALAAGLGFRALEVVLRRKGKGNKSVLLFSLLLIDLGPTTFQHPYPGGDPVLADYDQEIFAGLVRASKDFAATDELPGYRFIWAPGQVHPFTLIGLTHFVTGIPTAQAPHPGDLLSIYEFTNPLERYLSASFANLDSPEQLLTRPDFPLISAGVRLLNTRIVIATQSDQSVQVVNWPLHSPIIASSRLAPFHPEAIDSLSARPEFAAAAARLAPDMTLDHMRIFYKMRWIIDQTGVSPRDHICQQILVRGIDEPETTAGTPHVEVLAHRVWPSKVEMQVAVGGDCFVRLAYSYYPQLRVEIDGSEAEVYETAGRFIALRLSPGQHHITLKPQLSPLRRALLALALGYMACTAALWLHHWRAGRIRPGP